MFKGKNTCQKCRAKSISKINSKPLKIYLIPSNWKTLPLHNLRKIKINYSELSTVKRKRLKFNMIKKLTPIMKSTRMKKVLVMPTGNFCSMPYYFSDFLFSKTTGLLKK